MGAENNAKLNIPVKTFRRSPNLRALLPAVFAAVTFFLYAPVSMYLGNAEEFVLTLGSMWPVPAVCFPLASLLLFLPARFLPGRAGKAFRAFLFAAGLLVYLQGNFLFEDIGVLGGLPYIMEEHKSRIIINCALWLLVILISIVLSLRNGDFDRVGGVFSGIFTVFILLSTGILLLTAKGEYLRPRDSFVSDRGLYEASAVGDVIVIVPDMFDREYMDRILDETPEISESLRNFTYYAGVKGCYGSTRESIPAFLSDENTVELVGSVAASFQDSADSEPPSADGGASACAYIYTDGRFISETLSNLAGNLVSGTVGVRSYTELAAVLYRLVACQYAPDIFREYVWLTGGEFDELCVPAADDAGIEAYIEEVSLYSTSNTGFFYSLVDKGITAVSSPSFRLIHLYGAHYPYIHDAYLNPINPSYTEDNAVKAARGSLLVISRYLEELRAAGAYDSSLIVIMADHGYTVPGELRDPLLMIKEPGKSGPFKVEYGTLLQDEIPALVNSLYSDSRISK